MLLQYKRQGFAIPCQPSFYIALLLTCSLVAEYHLTVIIAASNGV